MLKKDCSYYHHYKAAFVREKQYTRPADHFIYCAIKRNNTLDRIWMDCTNCVCYKKKEETKETEETEETKQGPNE